MEGVQGGEDVFPGDRGRIIVPGGEVVDARWGLQPAWAKDPQYGRKNAYNARAETVAEKPTFRGAFRGCRCIVPVSAFYERSMGHWRRILPTAEKSFVLAGLYEGPNKRSVEPTFTLVTTEPNRTVSDIHDRMPVVLSPRDIEAWLDPSAPLRELHTLLVPCPPSWVRVEDAGPIGGRRKLAVPSLFDDGPS